MTRLSRVCFHVSLVFVSIEFPDRVTFCSLGYPGIHHVLEASFNMETFPPPKCNFVISNKRQIIFMIRDSKVLGTSVERGK